MECVGTSGCTLVEPPGSFPELEALQDERKAVVQEKLYQQWRAGYRSDGEKAPSVINEKCDGNPTMREVLSHLSWVLSFSFSDGVS